MVPALTFMCTSDIGRGYIKITVFTKAVGILKFHILGGSLDQFKNYKVAHNLLTPKDR